MIKQEYLKNLIYWICIFTVSGSMFVYGISKPFQFESVKNINSNSVLSGQEVMWYFYGYSKLYPIIIGVFQIIGSITILFKRTRIFGCLILTIILINIIIQDYIFNIIALSSAIYYQILIIILLLFDYNEVKKLIKVLFSNSNRSKINLFIMIIALIIAFIFKFYETRII